MSNYEVKRGDNLYNIVKKQYKLNDAKTIMAKVREIAKENNLKNINIIQIGRNLNLSETLKLDSVSIINREQNTSQVLRDETGNQNYYRANSVFGDIATKQDEYDQPYQESELKKITQATEEVEDVVVKVNPEFTSDTARDLQAYDIAAKPAGVGGFKDMNNTDAYKLFLEINADDFTIRETEYKGNKESKAYFDASKSDGEIRVFSSELINGKEYLAMRDNDNNIHYFDNKNGLSEVKFDNE